MIDYNKKGDIICKECNKSFLRLSTAHLNTHGMTIREYKKKHGIDQEVSLVSLNFNSPRRKIIKL